MAAKPPRTVLQLVPELRNRLKQHVAEVQQLVEPLLTERLSTERLSTERLSTERLSTERLSTERLSTERLSGEAGEPGEAAVQQERVTVVKMLAGTILQYAYATDLSAVVAGDTAAIDRAIDAFRKVSRTAL